MKREKRFFILLLLSTLMIFSKDIYLKVDTKGHMGVIKKVIVTKSGDIITAGFDKIIRVWDAKTGKEKRKILGGIGDGLIGLVGNIALSSDERYLAVGGLLGNNNSTVGDVRVYEYKSGKLMKLLKGHKSSVNSLAFSSDSRYLITASSRGRALIWRVKDFTLVGKIESKKEALFKVRVIKKDSRYFAVIAGYDERLILYDIEKKRVAKSYKIEDSLGSLAVSKNHIVLSLERGEILIFDYNLNLLKRIKSKGKPFGITYSKDEKLLIVGAQAYPYRVNIYDVSEEYKKIQTFKKFHYAVFAVSFLDNRRAIAAGGDNKEIYIWDIKTGEVLKKITGVGRDILSLGLYKNRVAWRNELSPHANNERAVPERYIDLNSYKIEKVKNRDIFKRAKTTYRDYSIVIARNERGGLKKSTLNILKDGEEIGSIVKKSSDGEKHLCYGFFKNYIVSGGYYGQLILYNLKGEIVARLVGHTDMILAIAEDGNRLISGGRDNVIKIWDLAKANLPKESRVYEEFIKINMKEFNTSREIVRLIAKVQDIDLYRPKTVKPILNIFVSIDNEWVIWTPSGFYTASKNGSSYIGFHINQGFDKEAEFKTVDNYPNLYRPDIIKLIIQGYSEKEALEIASKKTKEK